MLLRSSSTPIIATFLYPFSENPNRDHDNINSNSSNCSKQPALHDHNASKLSSSQGRHHRRLSSFSGNSSPASGLPESDRKPSSFRLRRAQSDGNLEQLISSSCDIDDFRDSNAWTRSSQRHKSMLNSVPSFSIFNNLTDGFVDGKEEEELEDLGGEGLRKGDGSLPRTVTIGESIEAVGSGDFSFLKNSMGLIKEEEEEEKDEGLNEFQKLGTREGGKPASPPLYLATGLGIDVTGFGSGVDFTGANFDNGGNVEEYYKKMVDQFPCHPLFLRNYAQVLQSKGDLSGAEEYYFRATLAEPGDGEILMQYANLVWELHHDQDRASSYFKRAAEAAPQDSHVLAAYARFLWETEDNEEDSAQQDQIQAEEDGLKEVPHLNSREEEEEPVFPSSQLAGGLGIDKIEFHNAIGGVDFSAAVPGEGGNVEEYYKRMVEESPCNPLFLRNYAQFLSQSKGDFQQAEECYLRAMLTIPEDGEIMSQYARLVWDLHHDRDKALCYFERAVQAAPQNSHVLAAYASFLWETQDEEEDDAQKMTSRCLFSMEDP
ncbi:uncharacterized protein LOC131150527 isoform X2 [Malania oleifera]|uniref:uncharacterized protein LOC131150527 isoform X2 n=1 Tax=Malania oleifera TaxID=397392 RepID=UPI0025AE159E|nr:uncharacterized protein LOC131150527 isoform X2 [Malania oleifera]